MRLPSFDKLVRDARETLVRFPFVLLSGAFAAVSIWTHTDDYRYALVGYLGISFLFALAVFVERRMRSRTAQIGAGIVGIVLLVLYFLSLPDHRQLSEVDMMRYFLFSLVAHLLAAFAPFTGRDELNGFWQYNKTLFIRFLTTALYTGVLYLGLTLAIYAIKALFDVDIDSRIIGDLGAFLTGIFATWFFLAGVPLDMAALEGSTAYPQGLKIFTQYVLLPLVTIYLIILYLYAGKILLTWELPIGWVSALVLSLAVAGILSLLLLYPIRNMEGNAWIRQFNAWFYRLLVPLVVLLFMAIGRRVGDYGITEPRYFVIALSIWLAGITLYFIISRRDNIKAIPISLAVVALLASFGPWGAFEVSVRSQVEHLRTVLEREKGLVDGKIVPLSDSVAMDREYEINSILSYLNERDRLDEIRTWLPGNPAVVDRDSVNAALGVRWYGSTYRPGVERMTITTTNQHTVRVDGFDYAVRFTRPFNSDADENYIVDGRALNLKLDNGGTLVVAFAGGTARFDASRFGQILSDSLRVATSDSTELDSYFTVDPERLVMRGTLNGRPIAVVLSILTISHQDWKNHSVENIEGTILLDIEGVVVAPADAPAVIDSVR